MQPWMIGTAITLAIFLFGHLGAAIWFASRVSTEMRTMGEDLKALNVDVRLIGTQNQRISVLEQRILTLEEDARETRKELRSQEFGGKRG